jgi:hypothetical protein
MEKRSGPCWGLKKTKAFLIDAINDANLRLCVHPPTTLFSQSFDDESQAAEAKKNRVEELKKKKEEANKVQHCM